MCINKIQPFFLSKNRPLYLDFIATVVAALIGIFIGFALDNWITQKSMNEDSKVRLNNMILECQYNGKTAYLKIEAYKDTLSNTIILKRLEDFSVTAVFNDDNILNLITPDQLSLLKCYLDAINNVNYSIDHYLNYVSHIDFKITTNSANMRHSIKNNCAELIASIVIIHEEFKFISQDKAFRFSRIEEFQKRLDKLNNEILAGKKISFTSGKNY